MRGAARLALAGLALGRSLALGGSLAVGVGAALSVGAAWAADPRLRADLVGAERARRVEIRDTACPGDAAGASADPSREAGLRRRIVDLAALEWEAFGFPVLDLAARGLPLVPRLDAGAPGRPRAFVPDGLNPALAAPARRMLRLGQAEDAPAMVLRIAGYWASVPGQGAVAVQNAVWRLAPEAGWVQPWSAAFVSWVMCEAGLAQARFPRAEAHAAYLDALFGQADAAFAPRPITHPPRPGDLVCATRGEAAGVAGLDAARRAAAARAPMHCDIVVGRAGERLLAIGGNVENAVALSVLPLERGRLRPIPARPWFLVLELRAPPDPGAGLAGVRYRCLGRRDAERCLDGM